MFVAADGSVPEQHQREGNLIELVWARFHKNNSTSSLDKFDCPVKKSGFLKSVSCIINRLTGQNIDFGSLS